MDRSAPAGSRAPGRRAISGAARAQFAAWAVIALIALVYVSVIIGPIGFNYVHLAPEDAWRMFRAMPFAPFEGKQGRDDWMANLLALVVPGFLVTGALWPARGVAMRVLAAILAFALCLACVLAIKYMQLYVPPRTVTLNYVLAQSIGALIGIALFCAIGPELGSVSRILRAGGRAALIAGLGVYTLGLIAFMLFPFDIVLTAADFWARVEDVRQGLLAWPGAGRPTGVRLVLVLVNIAAAAPIGALLALLMRRRSLIAVLSAGLVTAALLVAMKLPLLSGSPSLIAVGYLGLGITLGAAAARALDGREIAAVIPWLRGAVLLLALPYLAAVAFVSGLITRSWQSPEQALDGLYYRALMPVYNYYIVSKAEAMFSVIAHAVMYAPLGIMAAVLFGARRRTCVAVASILGLLLAVAVEIGRMLKPGMQPDINALFVAAAAAGFAAWITALLLYPDTPPPARAAPLPAPVLAPPEPPPRPGAIGALAAILCLAAVAAALARYPLPPWPLGAALAAYAVALWRWPSLWLAVVPAALPALDFGIWTGWLLVAESDLVILITIGVLALRAPPRRADLWPRGLAGAVLLLAAIATAIGLWRGLTSPLFAGSDSTLPYLMPENARRIAKGFLAALVLMPFLRLATRNAGATAARFGAGMVIGLLAVAAGVLLERAVFGALLDVSSGYRVVAMFTSMHIGGGHIGAFIAMALPFIAVCLLRPSPWSLLVLPIAAAASGYALIATFARAAYASAMIGVAVLCLGWALAATRAGRGAALSLAAVLLLVAAASAAIFTAARTPVMAERLATLLPDSAERLDNWRGGIALRDHNALTTLLGMGTGTYPRAVQARRTDALRPGDLSLHDEGPRHVLTISERAQLYLGQKVQLGAEPAYRLSLSLRSAQPGAELRAGLCAKLLLYSEDCSLAAFHTAKPGTWETVSAMIPVNTLADPLGPAGLRRPVELTILAPPDQSVDIADIHLTAADGADLAANGDFAHGTDRWLFTDDYHWDWRIENQYLMSLFEGGVLGLAAYLALAGAALLGAVRAVGRGERMGAVVAAAIVSFLATGLVDSLLEAPRLATLFYLVCLLGLGMLRPPPVPA